AAAARRKRACCQLQDDLRGDLRREPFQWRARTAERQRHKDHDRHRVSNGEVEREPSAGRGLALQLVGGRGGGGGLAHRYSLYVCRFEPVRSKRTIRPDPWPSMNSAPRAISATISGAANAPT